MDHCKEFTVKKMSEVFKVSRGGYYKWLKRKKLSGSSEDALTTQIKKAFTKSKETYGSPRVCEALAKKGVVVSQSTVARRMKDLNIRPKRSRKFKNTTDSNHDLPIAPNLLNRGFDPEQIDGVGKVWVGDITYIRVKHSFVYLTTVIDLANRMVVGWSLSKNMTDRHTTIAAMEKALSQQVVDPGLIFHSDRGVQYASKEFRKLLEEKEIIQSMSRKGNCYDNAVAESFFKTIKVEALYRYKFESFEEVELVVFDYIDGWYNTKRIHSSLGGLSPSEMTEYLQASTALVKIENVSPLT